MGWRELLRWSELAFRELSFQAIYAFRQGATGPTVPARELVSRAETRVVQSKIVVSAILVLLGGGTALLLRAGPGIVPGVTIASGPFDVGVVTILLSLEVTFLWWTGLQILPTLLASRVLEVLQPLPIDEPSLASVAALVYLRLFDLPLAVVLVITPLAVGSVLGLVAGLATVPAAFATVGFSLAFALATGRFFARRVAGSRGGGGRTLVRWSYLLLWVAPMFGVVAFVTAAPPFFETLAAAGANAPSLGSLLLFLAYPVAFAAVGVGWMPGAVDPWLAGAAAAAYTALAGAALLWALRSVRTIGEVPPHEVAPGPAPQFTLRPQRPALAVMTKDLRLASRTPGFAFLVLLPILDALALGVLSYARARVDAAPGLALGAVSAAALLATFFGPAFFAVEVVAYSYGRSLPLPDREVILGKTTLVVSIYLVAGAAVLGLTALKIPEPLVFAAFVLAELPAVAAAAFLELGLLFRWARARGIPVTNLYSGAWKAFVVVVPGLLVAGAPLVLDVSVGLPGMALASLAELGVVGALVLGRGRP